MTSDGVKSSPHLKTTCPKPIMGHYPLLCLIPTMPVSWLLIAFIVAAASAFVTGSSCRDPGTPFHGTRHGSDFSYGRTVEFSCDLGYSLTGSKRRTCLHGGSWSGSKATCTRKYRVLSMCLRVKCYLTPISDCSLIFQRSTAMCSQR